MNCEVSILSKDCPVKLLYYLQSEMWKNSSTWGIQACSFVWWKHRRVCWKSQKWPLTTLKKLSSGISSGTGEIIGAAREIDPVLSKQDRVKYEINKARAILNSSKSSEYLGEFSKIQKEFEGYITHAQVASEKRLSSCLLCSQLYRM